MSYRIPKSSGDSLLDYFRKLIAFNTCAQKMLEAQTSMEFTVWFEKADAIDHRATFLYLKEHKDDIPREYILSIRKRFWQIRKGLLVD